MDLTRFCFRRQGVLQRSSAPFKAVLSAIVTPAKRCRVGIQLAHEPNDLREGNACVQNLVQRSDRKGSRVSREYRANSGMLTKRARKILWV
jgi:hypothetical protein